MDTSSVRDKKTYSSNKYSALLIQTLLFSDEMVLQILYYRRIYIFIKYIQILSIQ